MSEDELLSPRNKNATLLTYLALMFGVLLPFFLMIAPYLLALVMGGILAILIFPGYRWLLSKGSTPHRSALLVILSFSCAVLAPVSLLVIAAIRQAAPVFELLSASEALSVRGVARRLAAIGVLRDMLGDPDLITARLQEQVGSLLKWGSGLVAEFATQLPSLLVQVFLAIFACYYFLLDGRRLLNWVAGRVPISDEVRTLLYASFQNTAMSILLATLSAAGVQAALMMAAFFFLGVPAAFLAGGATFIFAWVPLIGSGPVWLAGAAWLYTQGSTAKVAIMIVMGVITSLSDNIVRPWVLQGRDEMHPMVGIVAIFGGIAFFGILGVFIGPILAAMVIVVLDTWPAVAQRCGVSIIHGTPVSPTPAKKDAAVEDPAGESTGVG